MFQLIFKGECLPGVAPEAARANARTLFKASLEQIDRMFSGQPVVIRNQLEQAQAEKYIAVLARHGLKAYAQPMTRVEPEPSPAASEAPEPAAAPAAPPASGPRVEPGERPRLAGDRVDKILTGSALSLAPVGVTLSEPGNIEAPMFEHLDDWTLAAPGSDLSEPTEPPPPIVPDTSHLSLADDPGDEHDR
ncbi:hypothetical protein [Marinobacter sp. X15-166B]|uniref:hypothetical protein n=1 Tax=Marinobacter sp. X15-166B TaxID=1897620 RepID=UPI00085BFE57|nr:hypothetical protein [Marinobacter sp. X15-166B]OEY66459.1 hypothetical protein BG841_08310 [Marinobacter sp. X15-166B]